MTRVLVSFFTILLTATWIHCDEPPKTGFNVCVSKYPQDDIVPNSFSGFGVQRETSKLLGISPEMRSLKINAVQCGIFAHFLERGLREEATDSRDGLIKSSESASLQPPEEESSSTENAVREKIDQGPKAGELLRSNNLGMQMVWIPAGNFTMGSPINEAGRCEDESQVQVTLSQGFWLGETEVTQSEWTQLMGTEPWKGKRGAEEDNPNLPVTFVSGKDAESFLAKLNEQELHSGRLPEGWNYSLPTEAQWEYACRAGTCTSYYFGSNAEELEGFAWYKKIGQVHLHEVKQKKPNIWGLYDMHGNVCEWCRDKYIHDLPGGTDPFVGDGSLRIVRRGGSWIDNPADCRAAFRDWGGPDLRRDYIGFRVSLQCAR